MDALIQIRVLHKFRERVTSTFPCLSDNSGGKDRLILNQLSEEDGCVDIVYWVRAPVARPEQIAALGALEQELMAEIAELRKDPALRGKTLLQWWVAPAPEPQIDRGFLEQRTWKDSLMAVSH